MGDKKTSAVSFRVISSAKDPKDKESAKKAKEGDYSFDCY